MNSVELNRKTLEKSFRQCLQQFQNEIETNTTNESRQSCLEFNIQLGRVLKVLDMCIEKSKIAICMPYLIEFNRQLVAEKCGTKMTEEICSTICIRNDNIIQNLEKSIDTNKNIINWFNVAHRSGLNKLDDYLPMISDVANYYITALYELKSLAKWNISMTTSISMGKLKVLQRMQMENNKRKKTIENLTDMISSDEGKIEEIIQQKNAIIYEARQTIDRLALDNNNEINREINESHNLMDHLCLESKEKQKVLLERATSTQRAHEEILQTNLKNERQIREERLQIQQKLQNLINKYDKDVGERSEELHQLRKQLHNEQNDLLVWQIEYDRQDQEYLGIIAEKELEETRIREEKLLLFIMNRAARTIQIAYRKLLLKRKGKKKSKKKKGKR